MALICFKFNNLFSLINFLAINEADYVNVDKVNVKNIKKEKNDEDAPTTSATSKKSKHRADEDSKHSKSSKATPAKGAKKEPVSAKKETSSSSSKKTTDTKPAKKEKEKEKEKEDDELKGLEEMYYGIMDGHDEYYEEFPYKKEKKEGEEEAEEDNTLYANQIECPICDTATTFDSNEKLQTHLVSHLNIDGKDRSKSLYLRSTSQSTWATRTLMS